MDGIGMKASRFNILIERSGSVIVYNTLRSTFLIISRQNASKLQRGCCNESDYANKELYKAFLDKMIIVHKGLDELEEVRSTLMRTNHSMSRFDLIVCPTLACNFSCWYCYEDHTDAATIGQAGINGIVSFVQRILTRQEIKEFALMFFGGEPMLCYSKTIRPILEHVYPQMEERGVDFSVGITTNGSLLSKDRLLFLKRFGVKSLQITLDGNKERHNRIRYALSGDDSYTKIVENIREALLLSINVSVRLNISKDTNLDVGALLTVFDDLDASAKGHLAFSVHRVWQEELSVNKTVERIVTEIRDHGYKSASYFTSPSSIWNTCYADRKNHLTVNPRGRIYKCTACDFSEGHLEGVMNVDGHISWTPQHVKRMKASPLNVESCRKCTILPICAGGCSQRLLEHEGHQGCPLGMTDSAKQEYAYRVLAEKLEQY